MEERLWTFFFAVAVLGIQQLVAWLDRRRAEQAATKVLEQERLTRVVVANMKGVMEGEIAAVQKTADTIHTLVNNSTHLMLANAVYLTRRLANLTRNTQDGPADQKALQEAEEALVKHDKQQAIVDKKG
jgi:hypothetical protein